MVDQERPFREIYYTYIINAFDITNVIEFKVRHIGVVVIIITSFTNTKINNDFQVVNNDESK